MKKIPLTQGKFALVDDADFDFLSQWKWCFDGRYAVRAGSIRMHRVINKTPVGRDTDHINGDKLDNRRVNLRSCLHAENTRNLLKMAGKSSIYKGVTWDKSRNKWKAFLLKDYKAYNLGRFSSEEEAAIAYNNKAKEVFGRFSKLNIIKTAKRPAVKRAQKKRG